MTKAVTPHEPQTETWLASVKVTYEEGYVTEAVLVELMQPVTASPKAVACVETLLECCKEALAALSDHAIDRGTNPDKVACMGLTHTLAIAIGTATAHMPRWVITNSAQAGSCSRPYWLLDAEPTPHPGMRVYTPFEAGATLTVYPFETADDEDALADLNDLAARKGVRVERADVYRDHPDVNVGQNPYVLLDQEGAVITTLESLSVVQSLLARLKEPAPADQ